LARARMGSRVGTFEGCEKVVGKCVPMTLHTLPFCICDEWGNEPYLWLLKGVTTVLVARIRKEPSTQELDGAKCASSIPRSFVDHTNSMPVRQGTPH
jgi:hypothetical protein